MFPITYFLQFLTLHHLLWVEALHERPWKAGEVKKLQVKTKNTVLASPLQGTLPSMAPSSHGLGNCLLSWAWGILVFSLLSLVESVRCLALVLKHSKLRKHGWGWKALIRKSGILAFHHSSGHLSSNSPASDVHLPANAMRGLLHVLLRTEFIIFLLLTSKPELSLSISAVHVRQFFQMIIMRSLSVIYF